MSVLRGKRVVILGLGLHGGGIAAARFAAEAGAASVLISDMQSEAHLAPSIARLEDVLRRPAVTIETGGHNLPNILSCELVIKNPAVPPHAPALLACKERRLSIETDISIFLREVNLMRAAPAPNFFGGGDVRVAAVTGTKGKSSLSTALHRWNLALGIASELAGNITHSVLELLLQKKPFAEAVLELSSFQLGDLRSVQEQRSEQHPDDDLYRCIQFGLLTNIMPDHQNYYSSMEAYARDKFSLFEALAPSARAVLPRENAPLSSSENSSAHFAAREMRCALYLHDRVPLPPYAAGAWEECGGIAVREAANGPAAAALSNADIPPAAVRQNCAAFAAACIARGLPLPQGKKQWQDIFSIAHRKEFLGLRGGRYFYNDSAATIPQAMQLHLFFVQEAPAARLHLIAGGTDKNLDAEDFIRAAAALPQAYLRVFLLEGSYTDKLIPRIAAAGLDCAGSFSSLKKALDAALDQSAEGDIIALSPGCASFGMFKNEFDRGDSFKALVNELFP